MPHDPNSSFHSTQDDSQEPIQESDLASTTNANAQSASPSRRLHRFIVGACTLQALQSSQDDLTRGPGPGPGPMC
jgi:hypothetical protein